MYHKQSFPRLGDYIATVLQVTRLTKSIIRISGGLGSDTYNSFKPKIRKQSQWQSQLQ